MVAILFFVYGRLWGYPSAVCFAAPSHDIWGILSITHKLRDTQIGVHARTMGGDSSLDPDFSRIYHGIMKQRYRIPCMDGRGGIVMALISKPIILAGSLGRREVTALFDSGASYSCVNRRLAEEIAHLEPLAEPMEFETAERGSVVTAEYAVRADFFFTDTPRRFTDELVVIEELSEELIIGAATMQKWKIVLDFETEEVLYDKRMHRLRI